MRVVEKFRVLFMFVALFGLTVAVSACNEGGEDSKDDKKEMKSDEHDHEEGEHPDDGGEHPEEEGGEHPN